MRVPIGIIGSVLGATIAFYLAIITLVSLPTEGAPRWFMVAGIAGLSLIAGVVINSGSIQDYRRVSRDFRETSDLYNTLTSRLAPLLYGGIEEILDRGAKNLNLPASLQYVVYFQIAGLYRIVASTFAPEEPIRQMEFEPDEGLVGFVLSRKVPGFTNLSKAEGFLRDVFSRTGELIGKTKNLRDVNKGKDTVVEKWVYARPIFERSGAAPWSNRVVGVLSVLSPADDADSLFKDVEFQHKINSLASHSAAYLDVLQTLMSEKRQ
jgi:hypothetical protein